jgi:hypothetical protein
MRRNLKKILVASWPGTWNCAVSGENVLISYFILKFEFENITDKPGSLYLMKLWTGPPRNEGSIRGGGKNYFSYWKHPDGLLNKLQSIEAYVKNSSMRSFWILSPNYVSVASDRFPSNTRISITIGHSEISW